MLGSRQIHRETSSFSLLREGDGARVRFRHLRNNPPRQDAVGSEACSRKAQAQHDFFHEHEVRKILLGSTRA